jgi:hypothetical protein
MSFSNSVGTGFIDILCKNHTLTIGFYRLSKYYYLATKNIIDNVIKHLPVSKKEVIKYLRGSVFIFHNVGPVSYCDVISVCDKKVFYFNIVNRIGRHIIKYIGDFRKRFGDYCFKYKSNWCEWNCRDSHGNKYEYTVLSDKLILADLATVFKIYAQRKFNIEDTKNKTIDYLTYVCNTYSNTLILNVYLAINCDIYSIPYNESLLEEVSFNNESLYNTYISDTLLDRQNLRIKLIKIISGHTFTS